MFDSAFVLFFFFSSRRRHTRFDCDWSSDVCTSDLGAACFMPAELGGSQISSLLEAPPRIARVLRSPVADALVKALRAAAGVGDFSAEDAQELVRYAVRRGVIGPGGRGRGLPAAQVAA